MQVETLRIARHQPDGGALEPWSGPLTLLELVPDWLREMRSPNTRTAYYRDATGWFGFLERLDPPVPWTAADRGTVARWGWHLEQSGRRPATVARALAAVSSFYAYAVTRGAVAANPVAHVRRPVVDNRGHAARHAVTEAEAVALAEAADRVRDRALVVVLWTHALRVSEAIALDLDGLADVNGHRVMRVTGKGGRTVEVPAPAPVVRSFAAIATDENRTRGPLFASPDGDRLDRAAASRIVARLGRRAGLEERRGGKPVRPHQLRAGAITAAFDRGESLRRVVDLARHADPRVTMTYDAARFSLERHASRSLAEVFAPTFDPADPWRPTR